MAYSVGGPACNYLPHSDRASGGTAPLQHHFKHKGGGAEADAVEGLSTAALQNFTKLSTPTGSLSLHWANRSFVPATLHALRRATGMDVCCTRDIPDFLPSESQMWDRLASCSRSSHHHHESAYSLRHTAHIECVLHGCFCVGQKGPIIGMLKFQDVRSCGLVVHGRSVTAITDMLKMTGASTQPCLTPTSTLKGSDCCPPMQTLACMLR
ncbi:hypothetical protein SKAU_G00223950 [Synaphobranchus kaupii]|uniref:Uncharacterized protein n=1 Tax=Synaphobranchus kaupii TaxID=118154 RepID=A0A9Q1IWB8_SYNKA|nr:hypothetical protein SKAU_G00223950 [Synaphobranchus kaupii]